MRIHATGEPIDVEPYLDDLRSYLQAQENLVAAWIFGSYGTPYQTPLSDLDLAILFRPGRLPDWKEHLRLQTEISELLHEEDAAVMILNRAPVLLQFRVIESGRRLVCRDQVAFADFVELVIKRHAEDQAVLEAYEHQT